ncbi:hypothetical protein BDW59DRAFT_43485 [Aspergillus cavernicola]|uniref:CBS domain-containing protein n=1 Tax=Aspergillus cavernicola TaxID=176166 RepID=A0ABR4ILU1_9EURO
MATTNAWKINSGQVYSETVPAPATLFKNGPAWIHETPFLPQGWEDSSTNGAPSLMHSAMRKILSDQRSLTPTLFANVPWHLASYLWGCLGRCRKQTLHMWKLFATAYPAEFPKISQYRSMKIEGPRVTMREYLGLVKSDGLNWRVVLSLATSYARVPELVGIADIRNLVALEIAPPSHLGPSSEEVEIPMTALTDRLVRAWSELAQTAEAFSQFRVLILRHQTALSKVALRYLRALPVLQFVVVYKCDGIASAVSGGEVDGWKIAEAKQFPPETLYEFYQASCKGSSGEESGVGTPVLDFQIGQKKSPMSDGRANHAHPHSAIYLQRTALEAPGRVDPEPSTRKRKGVRVHDGQGERAHSRKAVMRSRTKDISDMLSEFF